MAYMQEHQSRGEVVTGLLYVDPLATDLHMALNTTVKPLNTLTAAQLCPGNRALDKINASLR
jgi:2-oxoglutarate ferredoxin oxidoreductase subunit beta